MHSAQQITIATRLEQPLPPHASMVVYVNQGQAPAFQLGRKGERAVTMRATRLAQASTSRRSRRHSRPGRTSSRPAAGPKYARWMDPWF